MIKYFNSSFITHRERKYGIIFSGESAEHILNNFIEEPAIHPLKHIRIQQLAKVVEDWKQESGKRYSGIVTDNNSKTRFKIIVEINTNFATIISCYKY